MAGPNQHGHAHFHRRIDAGHPISAEHAVEALPLTDAGMASPVQGVEQPTAPLLARATSEKPIGPDITNIVIVCSIV